MPKFETMPYFAQKGVDIPRTELFISLKNLYLQKTGLNNQDLADQMGVSPQYLSMWCNAKNNRKPPMWSIIRLCVWLDCYIMITGNKVTIEQVQRDY